ncbi:MAG: serine/threonine-protein kinase [Planctomycetota bacterium]
MRTSPPSATDWQDLMDDSLNPEADAQAGAAELLAARYLKAREEGEEPDAEEWSSQLDEPSGREEFRQLVQDAQWAQGLLPAQVRPGILLKDRYRILREIGSGGMGKVFEALDLQLERTVAIKVLATFGTGAFDPERLFTKESLLLASLQHPNIVAIHEAGYEGDVQYLVMDRVQGVALTDLLASVREAAGGEQARAPRDGTSLATALDLPVPDGRTSLINPRSWWHSVARIMLEISSTLQSAHGAGVVHRDIKPANILLRGDASPVVLDFGLAGSLDQAENVITRGLVGSVAYVAPEQAVQGQVGNDPRTDIYQLGLVLYELLTLQRAYPDDSMTVLLERITRGDFKRPRALDPSIPVELEAICLKAIETDPGRRYATARELCDDLQRFLDGVELPLAARGGAMADVGRRSRYFARRHRMGLLGAAAATLIALAWWFAPDNVIQAPLVKQKHWRQASGQPLEMQPGTPARLGDVLGIEVASGEPVYVYVLSVFGRQDPPDWVLPMVPMTDYSNASVEGPADDWGLLVETADGPTAVACTEVTETRPDVPFEGLWVFASAEPQPRISEWMHKLQWEADRPGSENPGVPLDTALALLSRAASGQRGGRLDRSGEPVQEWFSAEALTRRDVWPYEDPLRYEFFYPVELP